ncbi:hypothetical protein GCM10010503_23270 [Streptomyces lucensis JCM 4490]|uniref:Uncharacterized protein n=1 Tax=Streptomyces lucensis JCM 4490 TaxID=1306176 RepID=A0A918MQX8_9ACTN|nr:hypothetical protein [Streptomyces lucensis]GGW46026.1 hypothetical protein GCM10010503_23270 [Streptomyces lucensis JCM 4490]
MPGGNDHEDRPETALEEVLQEAEEAEKHGADDDHSGEAGDAITPNAGAQEQADGD